MLDLTAAVAPLRCARCGAPAAPPGLCADCLEEVPPRPTRLRRPPEGVEAAWALAPYGSPVGALLRRAKYGGDRTATAWLVGRLTHGVAPIPGIVAIIPVPAHWLRRLTRDVDVVATTADAFATRWGVPRVDALRRVRLRTQAGRAHASRAEAARATWRATRAVPETVLLVDDVVTTGTTAAACARELLGAGAKRVFLAAIAASAAVS